ncbi:MAG: arginine--tRNA ligase [Deltaproteobacteria bacterium]|nr:arginine--tRNA ligase [Deltaproteobacteria bacterium]
MKQELSDQIDKALRRLLERSGDTEPSPSVALDTPRRPEHGDFACNVAMGLAKRLGQAPRAIAESLVAELGDAGGLVESADVAGPGFINFKLDLSAWQNQVPEILRKGSLYGCSDEGADKRVQVEFVSANPTGPLSTGHGRNAVLGDCTARLLEKVGFEVTREYYFNDGGRQMRVLGESVKARYLERLGRAASPSPEALADPETAWLEESEGLPVVFPRDGYQGEYIGGIAQDLIDQFGEGLIHEPGDGQFRDYAQSQIFAEITKTLDSIGIVFDVNFNEKSLYDRGLLERTLEDLRALGLVYDAEGAVWLASTKMDLDRDRVLVKGTGEPTYLLPDIAYHCDKFSRGFDQMIDVLGADHIEQFPFVQKAVAALGVNPDQLELIMHQFVTITSQGEKVKQSTRRATFVTVDELVEQVGSDVFRFFMIERKPEGHLDFDLDLARDQNWRKNPAYYVQYAHARTYGIERKASEVGLSMPDHDAFDPLRLDQPEEIQLIQKLVGFSEMVSRAASTREPHHVAYYLRELAGLWNPYLQDGVRHRVLSDDAALTQARLGLVGAVRVVLREGLSLLGVSSPERM